MERKVVLTPGQIADLMRQVKPTVTSAELLQGVGIALRESGGQPAISNIVKSTGPANGSVDRGLWQINSYWHPDVSDAQAYDPLQGTQAAFVISNGFTDWSAWRTSNDNSWKVKVADPKVQDEILTGRSNLGFPNPLDPQTGVDVVSGVVDGAGSIIDGVGSGIEAVGSFFSFLLSKRFAWIVLGLGVLSVGAIVFFRDQVEAISTETAKALI